MIKLTTKDFQILEGDNTFDFDTGINMVVGPNASGKSSIFYAIENCLLNPNGVSDCINYNHDSCEVKIETKDESISWIRSLDSSTYINNKTNQKYVKASKLDSRDLANLGFYFDNKNRVVNIHNEWSTLFPFGESDSDMFRLFEDIFNISCSFLVIDEMKKDEQRIKSEIVQNQAKKSECLDRLDQLQSIKAKVKQSDVDYYSNLVMEKTQQTSKIREDYGAYTKSALLSNVVLPKVFDVSELYETLHNMQDIQEDFNYYQINKAKVNLIVPKLNEDILNFEAPNILKQNYEQYCLLKANILDYQDKYEEIEREKFKLEEKISKIKVCPTCGREIED